MATAALERNLLLASVRPLSYEVLLGPHFDKQVSTGNVKISCHVLEPTDVIQLHCKNIFIYSATITYKDASWDVLESLVYFAADDMIEIRVPQQLAAGATPVITLSYSGNFKDELEGFYRSKYETPDGNQHQLAVTFMEPTCPGQVFPCFDEPHQKAEFTLSALVSLVAGPRSRIESEETRIPISVLCPKGSEAEAKFALKIASDGLCFFEELFDSLYPLPKLDLVALSDMSSGAMENWGLITFRANHLLLDADDASLDRKQVIARVILHEISHSWFGNLVTMKYWDGLWLKEGFATLLAWYASDKLFPNWKVWNNYVAEPLQEALELDSLNSSHSVDRFVPDPTKAKQVFDAISYRKGCCIQKMLLGEIGEQSFFDGLKLYIRRHEFGNTESTDLWGAFQECTDYDIAGVMSVWTKVAGFPVIRVVEEYGNESDSQEVISLRLRQDRFIIGQVDSSNDSNHCANSQIYPVRISVRSESGIDTCDINESEITIPVNSKNLQKINANHDGIFRTSYSSIHLEKLTKAALQDQLSLRDCIGLLADVSALTAAGVNRTSELLSACLGFKSMTEFAVWRMIDQNLSKVMPVLTFEDDALRDGLQKLSLDILGPKSRELGWTMLDSDVESQMEFKAAMFNAAGLASDETVVKEARRLFSARIAADEKSIAPQLRYEVFGIVAAHANMREVEELFSIWKNSPNDEEKYLALECLGRVRNARLAKWVLGHAFSQDVKSQDIYLLLWLLGSSAAGAEELWEWTKVHWDKVEEAVPASMQAVILRLCLDGLSTKTQIVDVEVFFAGRDTNSYDQALGQAMEAMRARKAWAERDSNDVREWLKENGYM